jgi:hypothetical protein
MVNIKTDDIRRFKTTDRAHADLFNAVLEDLISNDKELSKSRTTTIVEALATKWEGSDIFKQRIDIPNIKANDTPIVSHKIEDNMTDASTIKARWKAYSFLDKVAVYDGYIELICFRKKPQRSFYLAVKEV